MNDLIEVQDMLNEARMLNQALFLAAESLDREKAEPLTCLCDVVRQKLTAVADALEALDAKSGEKP